MPSPEENAIGSQAPQDGPRDQAGAASDRRPGPFAASRIATQAIGMQSVRAQAVGRQSVGAGAVGALAIGALAIGAVAIGALAVGRLAVGLFTARDARIDRLSIGRLEVEEILWKKKPR